MISILKIIGIVLAVIICIILILLLLVLFVPVRYRAGARISDSSRKASASAGWFFNLVKVQASYDGTGVSVYLSVFGRRIYDIYPAGGDDQGGAGDGGQDTGPDRDGGQ